MRKIAKKIKKFIYVIYLYTTNHKDIGTLYILYGALAGIVVFLFFIFYDKNYYFLSLIKDLVLNFNSNYAIYFSIFFIYLYINWLFDGINYESINNNNKKKENIKNLRLNEKVDFFIYKFNVSKPNFIKIEDVETGEILRDDNLNRTIIVSSKNNNIIMTKSIPTVMNTLFNVNNKLKKCFESKDQFSTMMSWNLLKIKDNSHKYIHHNMLKDVLKLFIMKKDNKDILNSTSKFKISGNKIITLGKHASQINGHMSLTYIDRDTIDPNIIRLIQLGLTSTDKKIKLPNNEITKMVRIGESAKTGHLYMPVVPNFLTMLRIQMLIFRPVDFRDLIRYNRTEKSMDLIAVNATNIIKKSNNDNEMLMYDFFKNKSIHYKIRNLNEEKEEYLEKILKFFDGKLTMEELRKIEKEYSFILDPTEQHKYLMKWDSILNGKIIID